ncbi:hypothetical protein J633_2859 [Acinetobacter sp. 216872]|nr:hypothetical protein J514_1262 [Acinetobacter sp. 1396970]EXH75203.1 hypothetical protein J633_2859 [Acinetobacter sp. 216872]EXS45713.1 hypothetical protein J660_2444 [Acinetobacter sp. 88816]PRV97011.1 hypothetical protein CSB87_1477 [Acinetobacter sp. AR_0276]
MFAYSKRFFVLTVNFSHSLLHKKRFSYSFWSSNPYFTF